MPLYVGDYLADTVHLNGAESGAYLHLLMGMWRSGGALPNEPDRLARYCKLTRAQWDRVAPAIMPFFEVFGDTLTNCRLAEELQKYEVALNRRVERASLGGKAKALKFNAVNGASSTHQAEHKRANQNQNYKEERKIPSVSKEKGSRLPSEWALSELDRAFGRKLGLGDEQITFEGERFADHWRGKAGAAGVKLDWPATWRNWVRNGIERRGQAPQERAAWT